MPKAFALWDPLTAGSSVSFINSFAPSDDYLYKKSTSSTCAPVSNPPPVHSRVTPLVSFLGNRFLNLCFRQQPPFEKSAIFQPATNMYFEESRPLFSQPQTYISEKTGQFAQPPTCPRHRHFIENTLPNHQHVLIRPTNISVARPATIIFFQEAVTTVLPATIMSSPSYPFGNHAPSVGQCHSN